MGFLDIFSKQQNNTHNTCERDAVFEHILKLFFDFKDKYADKIVTLNIVPSRKIEEYVAFDIYFILDGDIKWYQSEETNDMLEFFDLVEDDGTFMTFEHEHNTFEQSPNYAYTNKKLKEYVRVYMNCNPNREFDLNGCGAKIKFW